MHPQSAFIQRNHFWNELNHRTEMIPCLNQTRHSSVFFQPWPRCPKQECTKHRDRLSLGGFKTLDPLFFFILFFFKKKMFAFLTKRDEEKARLGEWDRKSPGSRQRVSFAVKLKWWKRSKVTKRIDRWRQGREGCLCFKKRVSLLKSLFIHRVDRKRRAQIKKGQIGKKKTIVADMFGKHSICIPPFILTQIRNSSKLHRLGPVSLDCMTA